MVSLRYLFICLMLLNGCSQLPMTTTASHSKLGLDAATVFGDPKVIALCKAIEADDLKQIQELIDAGANVNAIGDSGVTPLLWAFLDNKIDRFKLLLENGADPNIQLTENIGKRSVFKAGDAVLHMAARSQFPEHFELVMKHGGNPNLRSSRGDTIIHEAITGLVPNSRQRIKIAVDHGADINALNKSGDTPVFLACTWAAQYGLAIYILDLGGDPTIRRKGGLSGPMQHALAFKRDIKLSRKPATPQQEAGLDEFIQILKDRGYNMDQAQEDIERWGKLTKEKPGTPGWFRKREAEELAIRDEKERQEREKAKQ